MITAGFVCMRDDALLLVQPRGKPVYYLPGGQIDGTETAEQALHRELREELDVGVVDTTLSYFCEVQAPAWGFDDGRLFTMHCYTGELDGTPRPSSEIERLAWFTAAQYAQLSHQAPAVCRLFELLAGSGNQGPHSTTGVST